MALEYDNSAFYYFVVACCSIYLLPTTYSIITKLSSVFVSPAKLPEARTSLEKPKIERIAREKASLKNVFNTGFMVKLGMCIFVWLLFFYMISLVWDDHEIASFDPFQILGLESGADTKTIKKEYRKLSLKYHPDKNKGNPQAEQQFMKIAKAYEALTDEKAKSNYEKFGNPDGRQALEVSIGLPTFMLEEDNHQSILVVYLLVLVVVIPAVVCCWYTKSKEYGEKMVMYRSYEFYHFMLSEHAHVKLMPETLAGSAEYGKEIPFKQQENEVVMKLYKTLTADGQMLKEKCKTRPSIVKANLLIHAYLIGIDIPKILLNDLLEIQKYSMHLIEAMLELSSQMRWLQTTRFIIEFSQLMTQALWVKDSSLMQIPHFTSQEVKHVLSGRGQPIKSAIAYARANSEDRKGMQKFTEEQVKDVEAFLKIIPDVDLELTLSVKDEAQIAEQDFVTLNIKLTRKNVKEGEDVQSVHCPKFPFVKKETWWFMLGSAQSNKLIAVKQGKGQGRVVEEQIQFWAPPKAGTYQFDCYAMNDSYVDVDIHRQVKMEVIPAQDLPAYQAHEEDLELDNEPTLFEQVMTTNLEDDTESDADDSSSDEDVELTESQRKRKEKRLAKKGGDSSDDSDDSDSDDEGKKEK